VVSRAAVHWLVVIILLTALAYPAARAEVRSSSFAAALQTGQNPTLQTNWENARSAATPDSEENGELKRRRGRAFVRSLLIPGWGQLTEDRRRRGYGFLAMEATLVASLVAFNSYRNWLEDDYRAYARQHAGVSGGHDHQFYVDIGNWNDRDAFNQQRLRYRQFDRIYTSPSDDWLWDSDRNRQHFKSIRIASDQAEQNALLVVGGLLLNHLLSAIDASRGVKKADRRVSVAPSSNGGLAVRLNI